MAAMGNIEETVEYQNVIKRSQKLNKLHELLEDHFNNILELYDEIRKYRNMLNDKPNDVSANDHFTLDSINSLYLFVAEELETLVELRDDFMLKMDVLRQSLVEQKEDGDDDISRHEYHWERFNEIENIKKLICMKLEHFFKNKDVDLFLQMLDRKN